MRGILKVIQVFVDDERDVSGHFVAAIYIVDKVMFEKDKCTFWHYDTTNQEEIRDRLFLGTTRPSRREKTIDINESQWVEVE